MNHQNKNCFRSQGGAVIEMKFRKPDSLNTSSGISHVVLNDETCPQKTSTGNEGHGLNKRYFYD